MPSTDLDRFQDLRFGIFVTWGIGTVRQDRPKEEEMRTHAIGRAWDRRATRFDADAWVRAFKQAGARYVIFVPSHELDFSLSRTALTDYRSRRDYTGEVADACARHGLAFGLYVHLATGMLGDSNHLLAGDRLAAFGRIRLARARQQDEYLDAWLTEQCTQYRPQFIWLDGWTGIARAIEAAGGSPLEVYDFGRIADTIHRCDPHILIGNKFYLAPHVDYRVTDHLFWDNSLLGPLDNSVPSECCDVLPGNRWFPQRTVQEDFLSAEEIEQQTRLYIQRFVTAVGRGVNYLLNVGPLPDGELQRVEVAILQGIGHWLERYGESVFATRPLPLAENTWGFALQGRNAIFLHVLDTGDIAKAQGFPLLKENAFLNEIVERFRKRGAPADRHLRVGPLPRRPRHVRLLAGSGGSRGSAGDLPWCVEGDSIVIDLAGAALDPVDTIIELP